MIVLVVLLLVMLTQEASDYGTRVKTETTQPLPFHPPAAGSLDSKKGKNAKNSDNAITNFQFSNVKSRIKMELVLKRTYYPNGTNGTIYINGVKICHSIELPWLNNKPQRSCIPEGMYGLKKRWSPKYKEHYELQAVPNRKYILVHPANVASKELRGCIAPVLYLAGEGKGSFSRMAFKALQVLIDEVIEKEKVFIRITSAEPLVRKQ